MKSLTIGNLSKTYFDVHAGTNVTAVHDISDGGLLVAVTEMALAGNIGATLFDLDTGAAFGEGQGRYLVTLPAADTVEAPVSMRRVGRTGGDAIIIGAKAKVSLANLRAAHEGAFPAMMRGEI